MPCQDRQLFSSNFQVDTPYLSQALAEHNADRVESGLPVADYLQLSEAERHDVLGRAQKIKSAARYTPIQMEPHAPIAAEMKTPSQIDCEQGMFSTAGVYLLAFGIIGVISLLWKIIG